MEEIQSNQNDWKIKGRKEGEENDPIKPRKDVNKKNKDTEEAHTQLAYFPKL